MGAAAFDEYCILCSVSNNLLETTPHISDPRGTAAFKTTLTGAMLVDGQTQATSSRKRYNPALLHIHVDLLCAALVLGTKFTWQSKRMDAGFNAARFLAMIAPIVADVSRLYVQISLGVSI